MENLSPPKVQPVDLITNMIRSLVTTTACTAAVALNPAIGALAATTIIDTINLFIPNTLGMRLDVWRSDVTNKLISLSQQKKDLLDFIQGEQFQAIFIKATRAVTESYQREKIQALQNAVLNTASGIDINEDLQHSFIEMLKELTPSHLHLLKYIFDHQDSICRIEDLRSLHTLYTKDTEKSVSTDIFQTAFSKLEREYLVEISDSVERITEVHAPVHLIAEQGGNDKTDNLRITETGELFIEYVFNLPI